MFVVEGEAKVVTTSLVRQLASTSAQLGSKPTAASTNLG
jgi:hypothetical protein